MTEDADLALPLALTRREESISDLLASGGFKPDLTGGGDLPVTTFRWPGAGSAFYVKFIAPLLGGSRKRDGSDNTLLSVAGTTALKLRYVEVLLTEPWTIQLDASNGFPDAAGISVRVAHPASYLIQKVLTISRRKEARKREKDLLYVHDTLAIFAAGLDDLREESLRILCALARATREEFAKQRRSILEDKGLLQGAALTAESSGRGDAPSAQRIAAVCRNGLVQLFD